MIKYRVACSGGHEFESWFADSDSFETQAKRGLIMCPACDSRDVRKAMMAPALLGARRDEPAEAPVALVDEKQQALRAAMRELRQKIDAATDDVGSDFPQVARAIHAGDEPERAIRGQATLAEAKALIEEGVSVAPLPLLPEEAN